MSDPRAFTDFPRAHLQTWDLSNGPEARGLSGVSIPLAPFLGITESRPQISDRPTPCRHEESAAIWTSNKLSYFCSSRATSHENVLIWGRAAPRAEAAVLLLWLSVALALLATMMIYQATSRSKDLHPPDFWITYRLTLIDLHFR
jgi:hypothetical protein